MSVSQYIKEAEARKPNQIKTQRMYKGNRFAEVKVTLL